MYLRTQGTEYNIQQNHATLLLGVGIFIERDVQAIHLHVWSCEMHIGICKILHTEKL